MLIKAYTPASPFRASLAAFRFLVWDKFVNSITRGKESVEELDELEELEELDELDELEELEELDELEELEELEELDELEELEELEEVEGPKRLVKVVLKLIWTVIKS